MERTRKAELLRRWVRRKHETLDYYGNEICAPLNWGIIKGRNENASLMVDSRFLVATRKNMWLILFALFTIAYIYFRIWE